MPQSSQTGAAFAAEFAYSVRLAIPTGQILPVAGLDFPFRVRVYDREAVRDQNVAFTRICPFVLDGESLAKELLLLFPIARIAEQRQQRSAINEGTSC